MGEPHHAPDPPRKKRHPLRWIFGSLGVLLVLAVIFVAVAPYTPLAKGILVRVLQQKLNVPVAARSVDLSWTGTQRVEDLQIGEPEGFPSDENLLRARSVRLETGLLPLIFDSGRAIDVRIDEPVAILRRN